MIDSDTTSVEEFAVKRHATKTFLDYRNEKKRTEFRKEMRKLLMTYLERKKDLNPHEHRII